MWLFYTAHFRSTLLICDATWWKKERINAVRRACENAPFYGSFFYCSQKINKSLCPGCLNVHLVTLFMRKGSLEARGLWTHPSWVYTYTHTKASWSVKCRLLCDLWPVDFLRPPLSSPLTSCLCCSSVTLITVFITEYFNVIDHINWPFSDL